MPRLNHNDAIGDRYDGELFSDPPLSDPDGQKVDSPFRPDRIVSGGQTGIDRAGLDVAIDLGIEHGGWCPKGRLAEDGTVPAKYQLTEYSSPKYSARTAQNVIDSDATLILYERKLIGGTLLTARLCKRHKRPCFLIQMDAEGPQEAIVWLSELRPATLNIAGPRESTSPGIAGRARPLLLEMLSQPV
ncbi:putative molybdenum carrier protein [Rubripirellula reticaptiva]|uniref:Putative molybdenum carrier n=1 Tax=Rubripirellula reticaptiva TaxID=2528013 RepID=A0A5C6EG15_9BACT|nr:putative molybdenum carrier protein [Rubripirellula reticaptiva]TWU47738.1 putative molybdenum carrier [Rubripirellula reticaptiva]